jgi:hypothetical protein
MRFFFDRSVPLAIAQMVRAIDGGKYAIVHHDEDKRFHEKTTDTEWMRILRVDGEPFWNVVSGDGRILKNKAERPVLDETGLPFFCLDKQWPSTGIYEYAWRFMKVWPRITAAALHGKGRIYVWFPRAHPCLSIKWHD